LAAPPQFSFSDKPEETGEEVVAPIPSCQDKGIWQGRRLNLVNAGALEKCLTDLVAGAGTGS